MYFQYLKLNKIRAALLEEVDIAKEPGPEVGCQGGPAEHNLKAARQIAQ